jgi:hypothetical protein
MPSRDASIDADIAQANSVWTQGDVNCSRQSIAAHHGDVSANATGSTSIITPTLSQNPSPTLAVVEIDKGIRKFWKHHGGRFAAVWRGMSREARERLLLTVGPDMAKTRNDPESSGQLLLIPEFVVSELANQGDALIRVIERAVDGDLNTQYLNDTQMVRGLIRDHMLAPEPSKRNSVAFLQGQSHVGQIMEINASRMAEQSAEVNAKFSRMFEIGFAVEGPVFYHVFSRRQMLLNTLALFMDEMRTNVLDRETPQNNRPIFVRGLQCSLPSCTKIKRTDENGRERPLALCSRCGVAAYCSPECQRADWKEHKKLCGKKKTNK